MIEEVKLKQL